MLIRKQKPGIVQMGYTPRSFSYEDNKVNFIV